MLRGLLLLIAAGALVLGGCPRGETEAEMRRRVRREERSRQRGLTRERERNRQAERRRLERRRRELVAKERQLEKEFARSGSKGEAKREIARLRKQLEAVGQKTANKGAASMGAAAMGAAAMAAAAMAASRSVYRRKRPVSPAPRRRLKRPRRHRSPSLEGLFE